MMTDFFFFNQTTKSGGLVQLIGMGKDSASIPVVDVIIRELKIQGSFRYANRYFKIERRIYFSGETKLGIAPWVC